MMLCQSIQFSKIKILRVKLSKLNKVIACAGLVPVGTCITLGVMFRLLLKVVSLERR